MASERVQQRYVVNGTAKEYLLRESVLDDAYSSLRRHSIFRGNPKAIAIVAAMDELEIPEELSNRELVEGYEPWCQIRKSCRELLTEIQFDLEEWERNEL